MKFAEEVFLSLPLSHSFSLSLSSSLSLTYSLILSSLVFPSLSHSSHLSCPLASLPPSFPFVEPLRAPAASRSSTYFAKLPSVSIRISSRSIIEFSARFFASRENNVIRSTEITIVVSVRRKVRSEKRRRREEKDRERHDFAIECNFRGCRE